MNKDNLKFQHVNLRFDTKSTYKISSNFAITQFQAL